VAKPNLFASCRQTKIKNAEIFKSLRSASPRDSLWTCLQCKNEEEDEGIQYPYLGGCFLMFCGPKWPTPPLDWFKSAEKQQVKLVGNVAKQP
jgi:hypothetical protein